MKFGISHDRDDESIEAKTRWFQSLSLEQRMDVMCDFTDLILSVNPNILDANRDSYPEASVRVLRRP